MRRFLAASVLSLAAAPLALAGEPCVEGHEPGVLKRAWSSICRDFKRNNIWPDPFVSVDRVVVRQPFDNMQANGWRIQNTLSDHHFVDDGTKLTEAGELKVGSIINESPYAYRAVFVLRSQDPEITAGRVASANEVAARVLAGRPPVPIFETDDKPRGSPAYYIDEVTRRYQSTTPDPRLPAEEDASSSSAGDLPN